MSENKVVKMDIDIWINERMKGKVEMYSQGPGEPRPIWYPISVHDLKVVLYQLRMNKGDQYFFRNPDIQNKWWLVTLQGNEDLKIEEIEMVEESI